MCVSVCEYEAVRVCIYIRVCLYVCVCPCECVVAPLLLTLWRACVCVCARGPCVCVLPRPLLTLWRALSRQSPPRPARRSPPNAHSWHVCLFSAPRGAVSPALPLAASKPRDLTASQHAELGG